MSSGPDGEALEALATRLRAAPAWQAEFAQRYIPAGFTQGTTERGSILLAPPVRLRFDYAGNDGRVFAVDGSVARLVDEGAGTCDAIRLSASTWGRLPLAALLDPGAARETFVVTGDSARLTLVPREPIPEIAEIKVETGADGLPVTILVTDASGNRNEFTFSDWRRGQAAADRHFQPSLRGQAPCRPEEG